MATAPRRHPTAIRLVIAPRDSLPTADRGIARLGVVSALRER